MKRDLVESINAARRAAGFLTLEEMLALSENNNNFLDPFSILISKGVRLGHGNTFYPGCTIKAEKSAEITIGGRQPVSRRNSHGSV